MNLSEEIQKEADKQFTLLDQILPIYRHQWIAERIAYQIGWGRLLLCWYHAGVQGKTPQMPGDGFNTWNYKAIADHFHQTCLYDQGRQQKEIFCKMISDIVSFVEQEHLQGNLDRCGVWSWCTLPSGKEWPLSKWVRVNTVSPWKKTNALLRKEIS